MYIFGGRCPGYLNNISYFDLKPETCTSLNTNGKSPTARHGSSLVHYQGNLYVFGGYDEFSMYCLDLFQLQLSSLTWKKIESSSSGIPISRYRHTAIVFQQVIFLFCFT
jgi:hypothetical protein